MSTAILDVRGWQNTVDLETGEKVDADGPLVEMARDVLRKHPYPGDLDPGSNRWVSDTALDLVGRYGPRFVFLTYAGQYFSGRYTAMDGPARTRMIAGVFREVERFVAACGFSAFVVGTGDMTKLLGSIDLTGLDGLAVCTHWSTRYAGLYGPSRHDMEALRGHPQIERIVTREEIVGLFGGRPEEPSRLPEYLLLSRKGYAFRTVGDVKKAPVMIPSLNFTVPVHAPGRTVRAITGVRQAVEEDLSGGGVALIVLEGAGFDDFLWPHGPCANGLGWHYYEPGEAQYLTVTSGRHRFLDYPTGSGYKYFSKGEGSERPYPFSGHFRSIPEGTLGRAFPGRSVAVGNKSMFMHMVAGADLSVECFARNLFNQGTMAVIHREDKP